MTAQQPEDDLSTALLIVDMQNGFCHPDGSLARMGIDVSPFQKVIAPCGALLEAARAAAAPVVFFRYVYQTDYADHGTLFRNTIDDMRRTQSLIAGSWDAEILEELSPRPGERVIKKNRPSGFFGNHLAYELHAQGIKRVVICGVTTSCCVEGTARDAGQYDFVTVVVEDASAEMTEERHNASLHTLGFLFAEIVSAKDAARLLRAPSSVKPIP